MTKFLYVGTNRLNQTGLSAKGYSVRRLGRKVIVKYGPVIVTAALGQRIHWIGNGPNTLVRTFRTVEAAIRQVERLKRLRLDHEYDPLPGRVRFWPPLKRHR